MKFETSIEKRLSGRHKACLQSENFQNKKILDIGCSYGWFEKLAKAKEIIGIDLCGKDLENAKKEVKGKKVKFLHGSALDLSKFKKDYFDIAVMFDVIEHLPKNSEIRALKEIKRILKKNGKLIISTPANNASKFLDPAFYLGHRHYSIRHLKNLFEKSGFRAKKAYIRGGFFEVLSMMLFYPCKWLLNSEIPFKEWLDKKRNREYLNNKKGLVTLFIIGEKI